MKVGRCGFAVCSLGHRIFAMGGYDTQSCESYDVLSNKWVSLSAACNLPDEYSMGITAQVAKHRFIFVFGGGHNYGMYPEDNTELIRRLDVQKVHRGWKMLQLRNTSPQNGGLYGVIPLGNTRYSETEDTCEFLVFGGYGGGSKLDRTLIFCTDLSNFEASKLDKLKHDSKDVLLGEEDQFCNN